MDSFRIDDDSRCNLFFIKFITNLKFIFILFYNLAAKSNTDDDSA